jgi:hypothetical protein
VIIEYDHFALKAAWAPQQPNNGIDTAVPVRAHTGSIRCGFLARLQQGRLNYHAIDPLDSYHITINDVHDPVLADAQPVVPAPVERLGRVRVTG